MNVPDKLLALPGLAALGLLAYAPAIERADDSPRPAEEATQDQASEDETAAMARALQDPLANVAAIMTDNDIHIGTGTGVATPVFQIQPVYSIDAGPVSVIPRAVIPVIGLAPEAKIPPVNDTAPPGGSTTWGYGDIALQAFVAPKGGGAWKWAVGPQFSLSTHSKDALQGAGWGAGPAFVLVGNLGENTSFAGIVHHMWGQDGFSTTGVQPMIYYNLPGISGLAIGYNGAIMINHNIREGRKVQIPLGAQISKATSLGGGYGMAMDLGAYVYPVKPTGGPEWSMKFGLTFLFPR